MALLSIKTITRIYCDSFMGRYTLMGAYAYRMDYEGVIWRCKQCDLRREWIDENGKMLGPWKRIARVVISRGVKPDAPTKLEVQSDVEV